MSIHILPTELTKEILSCLGFKELYRCKCVCQSWYKLIRKEFIIIEIFLRLRAHYLLRFKSLSRYCYNLISDMDFIRLHHKYQVRLNPAVIAIDENYMYSALLNPKPIVLRDSSTYKDHNITQHNIDVKVGSHYFFSRGIVDSCNGLLCFYCRRIHETFADIFFLFNPATRAHFWVKSFAGKSYLRNFVSGFGYDCKDQDYKIVAIGAWENGTFIYSLRNKSWTKTKSSYPPGSGPHYTQDLVFVNNAFHWTFEDKRRIMSFDLSTEQYHELPMPKLRVRASWTISLLAPDGLHLHLRQRPATVDLWIMKEYGVKYSWVKLFSIKEEGFDHDFRLFYNLVPVAYLKGGGKMLLGSWEKPVEPTDLVSYELKTKKLERVPVFDGAPTHFRARDPELLPNDPDPITVFRWTESLFPLVTSKFEEEEDQTHFCG